MKLLFDALLMLHIMAGSVSLLLFWIPVIARKRKGLHTLVGKWYIYLMWIVVITAGILSINNLIIGNYHQAYFLGFLSLITANPLLLSIQVMKSKKEFTPEFIRQHVIMNTLVVLFGFFLLGYGFFFVTTGFKYLMIFFGVLGVINIGELIKVKQMLGQRPNWYKIHYSGMIITGIAAYTAFFAFGGRTFFENILSNEWQLLPWILPSVIGIVCIRIMDRRFSKR